MTCPRHVISIITHLHYKYIGQCDFMGEEFLKRKFLLKSTIIIIRHLNTRIKKHRQVNPLRLNVQKITFFWHLSATIERSDTAFSPPKRVPFKVLPCRMAKRPTGKIGSAPTLITIVFPVPCIYKMQCQECTILEGQQRKKNVHGLTEITNHTNLSYQ